MAQYYAILQIIENRLLYFCLLQQLGKNNTVLIVSKN